MKRLGLVGGSTYLSTVDYYTLINKLANERVGGMEYPELVLYSVNMGDLDRNASAGRMDLNIELVIDKARMLKGAGVDALLLCANTMHLAADRIEAELGLPVIHIAEATAKAVRARNLTKIAVLGTRYTMTGDFILGRLRAHGLDPIVPDNEEDIRTVHDPIFGDFAKGIFRAETKSAFLQVIDRLVGRGAEGVILGCTEFPLLLKPEDIAIPSFDTTRIHSEAAVEFLTS